MFPMVAVYGDVAPATPGTQAEKISVTAHVAEPDGLPAANLWIGFSLLDARGNAEDCKCPTAGVLTDANGGFTVSNLPIGPYRLRAGTSVSRVARTPIDVDAHTTHLDIRLEPMPKFRIRLVGPDGRPVANSDGDWLVSEEGASAGNHFTTDSGGMMQESIRLNPDMDDLLQLVVPGVGYLIQKSFAVAFLQKEASQSHRPFTLPLLAGGTLHIRALETGDALPLGGLTPYLSAISDDGSELTLIGGWNPSDGSGETTITNLPPGTYTVNMDPIRGGAKPFVARQSVHVNAGATSEVTFFFEKRSMPTVRDIAKP